MELKQVRCAICHKLIEGRDKIEIEDGRFVCNFKCCKNCNCIICQDDGAVIGVDQDYCREGSKLDKPLGEPKVSTIRKNCRYYQKETKARHPYCTHNYLSRQLYSCEECDEFKEKICKIDKSVEEKETKKVIVSLRPTHPERCLSKTIDNVSHTIITSLGIYEVHFKEDEVEKVVGFAPGIWLSYEEIVGG